ncbi:PEP-CTERM sorting domain-containing protein [Haloferula chungangensis]|uniref:PEP-CTERM sorting domain-containing protein n=1 Tax=Haloferula chungangensis TaxID=1048331 RepID=A0ABW2L2L1_9BACT
MNRTNLLTAISLLGSLATSQAAFTLLDDFESYSNGDISSASNWSYDSSAGLVDGQVGGDATNRYLIQKGANTGGANDSHTKFDNNTVLIANNAIGTYFFRAYMTADTHMGTGLSPLTSAAASNHWNDAKPIIRIGNRVGTGANTEIYAYNDTTYSGLASNTTDGHWYNFWVLIDNTDGADSYEVHIQSDTDTNYLSQTQIGPTGLGFRNGTADGDLKSLFFRTAINSADVYFDDLYIDSTSHNLVNPVPEPAVSLLGALGLLGLLRRRR